MFTSTIRALRVLKVEKITDLSSGYKPAGDGPRPFSLFLLPKDGSTYSVGDAVEITAKLPYAASATGVPMLVGDWSPVVFEEIPVDGVDLEEFTPYAAEIKID